MFRTVNYRTGDAADWQEGILHTFIGNGSDCVAVVEAIKTGELTWVSVKPNLLRFTMPTEQWVKAQMQAQREAQQRAVLAPPGLIQR